jgi:3-phosphoshikimate 1-carboxyvinyltransferase
MKERPVGPLVEALNGLGANIQFLEKEGYPPLQIGDWQPKGQETPIVNIHAGTSSQFLSALLLIAPYLPTGLILRPEGPLVSRPYLEMTLQLMRHFGAQADWEGSDIRVVAGSYTPRPLTIEADWSAASYWYAMAAFSEEVDLRLGGLFQESWQGDSVLVEMMQHFDIQTTFESDGVHLGRNGKTIKSLFEQDFLKCPDIAQTLAVVCAGLGVQGLFSGLETLSIKETDRVAALKNELAKVGVSFARLPAQFNKKSPEKTYYLTEGKAHWPTAEPPSFATYGDHRMAMAFAPLAFLGPIVIQHPQVVEKSYPGFWRDFG